MLLCVLTKTIYILIAWLASETLKLVAGFPSKSLSRFALIHTQRRALIATVVAV